MSNVNIAFLLCLFSGFSTMIGFIPVIFNVRNINRLICCSLGFASGVMLCVSIVDLIPEAFSMISNFFGYFCVLVVFISMFVGIFISFLIDSVCDNISNNSLYRVGVISMIVIIIHNIPEGIVTFISTARDTNMGLSLAIAIALHNIPEGISISVPIYYATNSKLRAFFYTLLSALSEPFGAVITYLFLGRFINNIILGILFSLIAGIMLEISLSELLPQSFKYNYKSYSYLFFVIGILFMLLKFVI